MSFPHAPAPVKLVVGMFLKDTSLWPPVVRMLADRWGPVDVVSRWFPFDLTDYYEAEMGAPLSRRMVAFVSLIPREDLVRVKLETNRIEDAFAPAGKRRVNLDPGYVAKEQVVLATGKRFSHRIYIGQGIYADLTLLYRKGGFHKLAWTYPDYCRQDMLQFLKRVRDKYVQDLRGSRPSPTLSSHAVKL